MKFPNAICAACVLVSAPACAASSQVPSHMVKLFSCTMDDTMQLAPGPRRKSGSATYTALSHDRTKRTLTVLSDDPRHPRSETVVVTGPHHLSLHMEGIETWTSPSAGASGHDDISLRGRSGDLVVTIFEEISDGGGDDALLRVQGAQDTLMLCAEGSVRNDIHDPGPHRTYGAFDIAPGGMVRVSATPIPQPDVQ